MKTDRAAMIEALHVLSLCAESNGKGHHDLRREAMGILRRQLYGEESEASTWWHDHAAERMRVLMMWPQRCNYQPTADVLAAVKRLNGGEPLWVSQARVLRAMTMTGHAIARGHQR